MHGKVITYEVVDNLSIHRLYQCANICRDVLAGEKNCVLCVCEKDRARSSRANVPWRGILGSKMSEATGILFARNKHRDRNGVKHEFFVRDRKNYTYYLDSG